MENGTMSIGAAITLISVIVAVSGLVLLIQWRMSRSIGKIASSNSEVSGIVDTFIKTHNDNCPNHDGTIGKIEESLGEIKLSLTTIEAHVKTSREFCPRRNGSMEKANKAIAKLEVKVEKLESP